MPPSEAQEAVERFKRLIEAQDRRASAQMIRAYAPVYQRLQRDTIEFLQRLDLFNYIEFDREYEYRFTD